MAAAGPTPAVWVVEILKDKEVSKDVLLSAIADAKLANHPVAFTLVSVMTLVASDSERSPPPRPFPPPAPCQLAGPWLLHSRARKQWRTQPGRLGAAPCLGASSLDRTLRGGMRTGSRPSQESHMASGATGNL